MSSSGMGRDDHSLTLSTQHLLAREFRVFRSGVGLTVFTHFTAVMRCQRPFLFPNRIRFDVKPLSMKSHLHYCHPVTPATCRSVSILIKGQEYLSLTRLPMKISVPSGTGDNESYRSGLRL